MDAKHVSPLFDALVADGPVINRAVAMRLYGQFAGRWDVELVDDPDGTPSRARGEWIFGYVLEGRAIQDVFIVPGRDEAPDALSAYGKRYGTTLRMIEPATGAWRIIWINPVTGAFDTMLAREQGGEIVQEGVRPDGTRFRWIFSEITPDRFLWRAEVCDDEAGDRWHRIVEMTVRRSTS